MGNRRQRNSYYVASNKVRGSAETNRGLALNNWQKQTVRTLFEGGYGSRAETSRGNTVVDNF